MSDLFHARKGGGAGYTAKDIEVLEGLEPVRKRPSMYVGGTDSTSVLHLAVEILDNAMDEAVSGFAQRICVELLAPDSLQISDDGRGIPVDAHPKFKDKPALEVIVTTLHSGGKFSGNNYYASGGLHGVGLAVVNALSRETTIQVSRDGKTFQQTYSRGKATSGLETIAQQAKKTGTVVRFSPDPDIFPDCNFNIAGLFNTLKTKAYLFKGITIDWQCADGILPENSDIPQSFTLHYPNGLADLLADSIGQMPLLTPAHFMGRVDFPDGKGHVEWGLAWLDCLGFDDGFLKSFCNTISTTNGGTHETGLRMALLRGVRTYAELANYKKISEVTADDILATCGIVLSVFLNNPAFQGQTKERLTSTEATKLVENAIKDSFDLWLADNSKTSSHIIEYLIERAEDRKRKKKAVETARASATKRLRLPGKLADCTRSSKEGTELFIVEGDSAGGSAKQARDRATQAILPLRGKILNVANASAEKFNANQEVNNLLEALGCGTRNHYNRANLRYDKVIIMTDADVDGAHIASLLMTLFYQEMPQLINDGHLYLACPPLYRITAKGKTVYAADDGERDKILASIKSTGSADVGRFKGLGEMMPGQLKETTMNPATRTLLKVQIADGTGDDTKDLVSRLMGKRPEAKFKFIKENAKFVKNLDI